MLLAAAIAGLAAWAWFEAGWLRRNVIDVELPGVPPELDGLRIAHLSDFHLGVPSRGRRAVREAVEWVIERRPDLVCITGDLVSRRSGMRELERLLADLPPSLRRARQPRLRGQSRPVLAARRPGGDRGLENVTLLGDESVEVELRGRRVQIVGVDAQSYAARTAAPDKLADSGADLRLLLCHFPGIVRRIPEAFHLILAGHYHAGQIVVPYPGGRLRLAHLRARDIEGVYEYGAMKLHVSAGLGTTFIPFRLFARPEVTELVVRST